MSETNFINFKPHPERSALILLRHASSDYTSIFPDINRTGLQQLARLKSGLEPILAQYNRSYLISSSAERAKGTATELSRLLNLGNELIITAAIDPLGIKDESAYLEAEGKQSDPYRWMLFDPSLEDDNLLTEGRKAVENRAMNFLQWYPRAVEAVESESQRSLTIAVTHLEPMAFFALSAFPGLKKYPIDHFSVPANAEPLVMEFLDTSRAHFNVVFRDIQTESVLDPAARAFIAIPNQPAIQH